MKYVRYGKYTGEPADAVDLEELVKRLGDFFLQSGFESQFYGVSQMDPERSMEALREAILRALQEGDLLPENAMSEELREMLQNPDARDSKAIRDLLDKLMERLAEEGFIRSMKFDTPLSGDEAATLAACANQLITRRRNEFIQVIAEKETSS